jgi:hypothetical protein
MPSGRKTHQAPNQRADDPRDDITDEVVPTLLRDCPS